MPVSPPAFSRSFYVQAKKALSGIAVAVGFMVFVSAVPVALASGWRFVAGS